jgi:hypothetical protein
LLRHVAFVLEGGHLVACLYAGHLRGHDLDLLVRPTRPARSADLPNVVTVGDIPASHVFFSVDWVCWPMPHLWPLRKTGKRARAGNWSHRGQEPSMGREAGDAISVPSPLKA